MRKSPTFVVERKRSFAKVLPPVQRTHLPRNSFLAADIVPDDLETSLPLPEAAPQMPQPGPRILPNLLAIDPLEEKLKAAKTRGRKPKPPAEAKPANAKPAKVPRPEELAGEGSMLPSCSETSSSLERRIPRAKGDLPAGERWKRRLRHLKRLH